MQTRTYSHALITVAASFFLAILGTNLILDPQGVLGTGLPGRPLNANDRYLVIRAYQEGADRYDGALFGSSRARAIPIDELSRHMDGATFANFPLATGQIIDYLPMLEYVVRSKAAQGKSLRAVFLLLDADSFGDRPIANNFIQTLFPPDLSGDSAWRFIWRNLSAILPRTWLNEIAYAWSGRRAATPLHPEPAKLQRSAAERQADDTTADLPGATAAAAPAEHLTLEPVTTRPDLARQLGLLVNFVDFCRAHGIRLAVALSPLHRAIAAQYDPHVLAGVAEHIAEIVPVWDFGSPEWLSGRADLWRDTGHFQPEVAKMMLDRIFAGETAGRPKNFGVLRSH